MNMAICLRVILNGWCGPRVCPKNTNEIGNRMGGIKWANESVHMEELLEKNPVK
ncbi:hypothetical protein [Bacillus sp. J33]|uniref:hypothetical protein n=1 Tax=Bacillus sp. J33 TaxID=935836 RepID=UPI0012FA0440|nr:hypothetical protein [Bacillus sp. J33]